MIRNIVFDVLDVLIDSDGPIHGSVDLLMEVKSRGFKVYSVTNMHREGFQQLKQEYPFLRLFDGVVISGAIGMAKPDPEIFRHLLTQFSLEPSETLFIDDKAANVRGAIEAGLFGVQFENPRQLEQKFEEYKILDFGNVDNSNDNDSGCCGGGCGCH